MTLTAKDHPYLAKKQDQLPMKLGINGLGRIGKLALWHHVSRKSFEGIVLNIGREAGQGLQNLAEYVERGQHLRFPRPVFLGCFLVGSSRVDLQACKLEYSIVSPK